MQFDLNHTQELVNLFQTPRTERDVTWQKKFLSVVVDASLASDPQQIFLGPDKFFYFQLKTPPEGQEFTTYCISHVLDHCLAKGVGIAINPTPESAEWVFSYGDLWNLKVNGTFDRSVALPDEAIDRENMATEVAPGGQLLLVGAPDESYFPNFARQVIKTFFSRFVIYQDREPQCLLMVNPGAKPMKNLVFNFFAQEFKTKEDYAYVMRLLAWHLPKHVGLIGIDQNDPLQKYFRAF